MSLFVHEDFDGDSLELLLTPDGRLRMGFATDGASWVGLDREAAERLHNALGEWLYPTPPAGIQDRITDHMKAVTEGFANMAAAVQRLHLTTMATVRIPEPEETPAPGRVPLHLATEEQCQGDDCDRALHLSKPLSAPRQLVGCTCGHRWGSHGDAGCSIPVDSGSGRGALWCECTRTPPSDALR